MLILEEETDKRCGTLESATVNAEMVVWAPFVGIASSSSNLT